MRLIDSARDQLSRQLLKLAKSQFRASLRKEIRQAERRKRQLEADLADLSYYPYPSDFPTWHQQEWQASVQPLRDAIREIKEELNLELDPEHLKLIHVFPPTGDEPKFFRAVYFYESDKIPNFNRDDFTDYYWLTPDELLAKLEAGEPAKRSLKETVKYLVEHQS